MNKLFQSDNAYQKINLILSHWTRSWHYV